MFIIIGRRWFDRDGGNTYHSVTVMRKEPGKPWVCVGRESFAYGRDDQYLQTACQLLQEAGLWPTSKPEENFGGINQTEYNFILALRSDMSEFFCTVSDVGRRKDL